MEKIDRPDAEHFSKHLRDFGRSDKVALFVEDVLFHIVAVGVMREASLHVVEEGLGAGFLIERETWISDLRMLVKGSSRGLRDWRSSREA